MEDFTVNLSGIRFEIPQSFINHYTYSFNSGDLLFLLIDDKEIVGIVNRSGKRVRLKIIKCYFDINLLGKKKIKLLKYVNSKTKFEYPASYIIDKSSVLYLDLLAILINNSLCAKSIIITEHNNKLYCFKKSAQKLIILNRFVNYYSLLEILGLYQGDGLRNNKEYKKLEFANREISIINTFLDFLDEWGLKRNYWKASISLTGEIDSNRKQKSLEYWSSNIKIPKNNFRGFLHTKTLGQMHTYWGTVSIIFDSKVITTIFLSLVKNVNLIIQDEKSSWYFINGLLAADGAVEIKKDGRLSGLNLAYDTPEEALFYKNFIENRLFISTRILEKKRIVDIQRDKFTHSKWHTFYRLIKNESFKLHNKRYTKLISGFLLHKRTKMFYRCLNNLNCNSSLAISIKANYKNKSGFVHSIKILEKENFVIINKSKKGYSYKITLEGKIFLNLYKELITFAKVT